MSVPEQTPYKEYTGNGVTNNFALEFTCDSKQELKVFIDNVEPELSTWSLVGGGVVFTTAPASGSKIVLKRATKLERTTNYSSVNNSFRPDAINKDLDRVWYALQDQAYKLGQYDLDYSYAINTSNQALSNAATAQQKADSAYNLADTTNTETRPIERGGTGATTAAGARINIGVYSQAEVDALVATGGQGNIVGVSGGGTGATTAAGARTNLGVMSSSEVTAAINTAIPQATETALGVAKIATTAIAQAGTNDTDIITPAKLKGYLDNKMFGVGQTVQNVTASRALSTTYTNSTNKPILISITVSGVNDNLTTTLTVDGVAVARVGNSNQYGQVKNISYVIPPSSTYSVTGSPITLWTELR